MKQPQFIKLIDIERQTRIVNIEHIIDVAVDVNIISIYLSEGRKVSIKNTVVELQRIMKLLNIK